MTEPRSREGSSDDVPPVPAPPAPTYPPPPYPPAYAMPAPPLPAYGYPGGPPPPPGGGPTWGAPPLNPPGGRKTPWVLLAVVGVVLLLLLGAVGTFMLTRSDTASGPTSTMTTMTTSRKPTERQKPSTTRTTPPSTGGGFDEQLRGLIPPDYPVSACTAASPPAPGALATMDCTQSSQPGGPEIARYSLFADLKLLNQRFTESLAENDETLRCPNFDADSPANWTYNKAPEEVAGQVACGTYKGNPDVMWTQNGSLILADVQSKSLDDLHAWWLEYS